MMKLNIVLSDYWRRQGAALDAEIDASFIESVCGRRVAGHAPAPVPQFFSCTDVAQSFYSILIAMRLVKSLSAITVAASILAALCHDLDHPGTRTSTRRTSGQEFWSVWKSTAASTPSSRRRARNDSVERRGTSRHAIEQRQVDALMSFSTSRAT